MSEELERFELVYDRVTQQPVGVTDLWQPGAMSVQDMPSQPVLYPVPRQVYQPIQMPVQIPVATYRPSRPRMPSEMWTRVCLYAAAAVFAAGLAVGCWLFGSQTPYAPVAVVCPPPGVQVAARPAECGPGQGVDR
ncbi:hypothetical protein K7711_31890 [Nocardia sp. CA2R105]|uniref:hypothetical protein n=1 Tax=Nocardia coffeae TaxID=2873381 RepID=UPI001CA6CAA0|nr:hypothetical protein [Nocardia coffeae]MBY8861116.1 hypothetical protein [Nocardia coffeae]